MRRLAPRHALLSLALASAAVPPVAAAGQVIAIDEGSFTISRDGERVGREDFSIRTLPAAGGPTLLAQGNLAVGPRRMASALKADTAGFPVGYDLVTRQDGRILESYSGQTTRNHYSSRLQREDGESAHEFRLPPRTVAVDDELVHQLWGVARRGPGATVPVLVPRRNVIETVRVELAGTERLTIDVREFEVQHLILRTLGSGIVREVWLDRQGRILKAVLPAQKIVAVRD